MSHSQSSKDDFQFFDITVVNLRNTKDCTVVDRTTIYGNPFPMKQEAERVGVCKQYEEYFYDRLTGDIEFRNAAEELVVQTVDQGYIRLGCWCAPRRCHADTLARFINSVLNEE